jgi:VanZ family protein
VLKRFYFLAAIFWTGMIIFLSLVQFSDLPFKTVSSIDKIVHVFFHIVFTILWFLYLEMEFKSAKFHKPLIVSFLFSFFFGVLIEILQEFTTISRHADLFDVVANVTGATMASIITFCFYNYVKMTKD